MPHRRHFLSPLWFLAIFCTAADDDGRFFPFHLTVDLGGAHDKQTLLVANATSVSHDVRRFAKNQGLTVDAEAQIHDAICLQIPCRGPRLPSLPGMRQLTNLRPNLGPFWEKGMGDCSHLAGTATLRQRLAQARDRHAAEASATPWQLARTAQVTGRAGDPIFVVDGVVPKASQRRWAAELRDAQFRRSEADTLQARELGLNAWVLELQLQELVNTPMYWRMHRLVEHYFLGKEDGFTIVSPLRSYINSCYYGDAYFMHTDFHVDTPHVSVIYYANAEWSDAWQGETVFYDAAGAEAELVVQPKPGRVVAFRGSIPHRSNAPSRLCHGPRYTWVFKFALLKEWRGRSR